jgi:hypothetical protein
MSSESPPRGARTDSCTDNMMLTVMMRMGGTTENMPTASPWIITVAGPVSVAAAMERTGLYAWDVQYSVVRPMPNPDTSPITTVRYSFSGVANPSDGIRVPVCAAADARPPPHIGSAGKLSWTREGVAQ